MALEIEADVPGSSPPGQSFDQRRHERFLHCRSVHRRHLGDELLCPLGVEPDRDQVRITHAAGITLSVHGQIGATLDLRQPVGELRVGLLGARVLVNDPGTGVMRHVDAGYDRAVEVARERGLRVPMLDA